MTTLYRKYRPQTFSDLVGQEYIVQTITNEIVMNKIAHAYLFSGSRGTGKTTCARLLAKAANCQNRNPDSFEPCDTCSSCTEISQGKNIDVIEIDAASQTGVDNVRENIIENSRFKPTKSKYKIFIIDEVHMLSTSAFNALLKTIEEPPEHIIFILATTELHKLPATVVSRCQRFIFRKIPHELMKQRLEKICSEEQMIVDTLVIEKIIAASDGGLRDAESLLGQICSLNKTNITEQDVLPFLPSANHEKVLRFIEKTIHNETNAALADISHLATDGIAIEYFFKECIELLRILLALSVKAHAQELLVSYSTEETKRIRALAEYTDTARIIRLIDHALVRSKDVKTAPVPELPLEIWTVEATLTPSPKTTDSALPPPSTQPPIPEPTLLVVEKKSDGESTSTSPSSKPVSNAITITLDEVEKNWEQVISSIGTTSPSLTFIMRMCTLEKVDSDGLWVSVPYELHKEKLSEYKNKKLIEQALSTVYQQPLLFMCTVKETTTSSATPTTSLDELAAQFGGEVIG